MSSLKLRILTGLLAVMMVLPGCVTLAEDQPTPTPIPTPSESNKPTYTVTKGNIVQTVKALGRVAASQEATLFFKQAGRMRRVYVDTNQKVKAGDVLAELETGNLTSQISQARINLDIAQIRLSQLVDKSGTSTAVAQAQASLNKSQADLAKAQDDLDTLKAGATTADLKSAEQSVASAQAQLDRAKGDLATLKAGASSLDIKNAQLAVSRAQLDYNQAVADQNSTCKATPTSDACNAAKNKTTSASYSLSTAKNNLAKLQTPATSSSIAAAQSSVNSATAGLASAQARLSQLRAAPKDSDVSIAQQGVDSAKASLDVAQANYDSAVSAQAKGGDYDVQIQQKQVELSRASLQILQDQLDLAQIKAPFEGTVITVTGREGDDVKAYTATVTVANPKTIQIAVELAATDLVKIQLQQTATIVLTTYPTEKIPATVVFLPSLAAGSDPQLSSTQRTVKLDFTPTAGRSLELGSLANVTINTQVKEGVLILPNNAIRTFGGRKYVRIAAAGGRNQEVDVEVGISNETQTEIVSGLKEGQVVIGQ